MKRLLRNGLAPAVYRQKTREWRSSRTRGRKKSDHAIVAMHHVRPLSVWPSSERALVKHGNFYLRVPRVFSFIHNPEETIATLQELRSALERQNLSTLYVDHRGCEVLDLCASVVMDSLLLRAARHWWVKKQRVQLRGDLSEQKSVNDMLIASGVPRQLKISGDIPAEVADKVVRMDLFQGRRSKYAAKTSSQELAATQLKEYINKCLSTEGSQLTEEGENLLLQLVTEVLDNAEQHARTDDHWYVIAYFSRFETENGGICHIVIFNYGDSIAQSLRSSDAEEVKEEIRALAARHASNKLFNLPFWQEETLWTLYSLQEGVTRLAGTKAGRFRGNGTVKMLEFFQDLSGSTDSRMCLVSGNSFIRFDSTCRFREGKRGVHPGTWKVVAFNDKNDLDLPPDKEYVHSLKHRFPGTLVSLRFPIDRSYMENRESSHARAKDNKPRGGVD